PLSPLVSMMGLPSAAAIDVMTEDNAQSYWERSDHFDMALDLTAGRRGLTALGQVVARWVSHLMSVEIDLEPLTGVRNVNLTWYVGLDADGTKVGDALWNGEELDEATRSRVVGLYRLTFRDPELITNEMKGDPIYLILAMSADKLIRVKPQNLLAGLPIRHLEAVSLLRPASAFRSASSSSDARRQARGSIMCGGRLTSWSVSCGQCRGRC